MPLQKIPNWIIGLLLATAILGFADAAYLTAAHVRGATPPCSILTGCESVLTSRYSEVAGFPVAALGMLYYGTFVVLLIAYIDTRLRTVLSAACWLTAAGFLATLFLVYAQAFLIGAWCPYCLFSAATSTLLFGFSTWIMRTD